MSIRGLENLLRIFKGESSDGRDKDTLLEELFLTVLGRAISSDSNIAALEIETVQKLYKEASGKEVEAGDVRHAAQSEIFERNPLESYVKAARKELSNDDKQLICRSLQHLIAVDDHLNPLEIDFFNKMIGALDMTPAEIVGLSN